MMYVYKCVINIDINNHQPLLMFMSYFDKLYRIHLFICEEILLYDLIEILRVRYNIFLLCE